VEKGNFAIDGGKVNGMCWVSVGVQLLKEKGLCKLWEQWFVNVVCQCVYILWKLVNYQEVSVIDIKWFCDIKLTTSASKNDMLHHSCII
jgi:hypothetical protein